MSSFTDRLLFASRRNESLLCVGLDPDPRLIPPQVGVAEFNRAIIEATQDLVCAYKPNLAFYEALGIKGWRALEETLRAIPDYLPVIGDGKRGDIGNTAEAYARALFEVWGFDAATVNPYLGRDSVQPFLDYQDRGVLIVCRTSNPGAGDFQDLLTNVENAAPWLSLYERVAQQASAWNDHGNVGLVVGATAPSELRRVREVCPHMPILIPGVGAQGGGVQAAVRAGVDAQGERAIVNASRGVIYASDDPDTYPQAARDAALHLRDTINRVLDDRGLGWTA